MKLWTMALNAYYARTTTQLAVFWLVVRTDGQEFGWVDHDEDLTIAAHTYRAAFGLRPSETQSTTDMQPGSVDVTAFLDVSTEEEIEGGIWDDATVLIFEAPWKPLPPSVLPTTVNILHQGTVGQITRRSGTFTAQLHGLLEQLDTVIGEVYTPTCPWQLGDSRCGVDLGPFTHTGTITHQSEGNDPRLAFADVDSDRPSGYYNEGRITFTSGRNTGRTGDIRAWDSVTFRMHRPMPFPVEVGDQYTAIRGDDKRIETCNDVFHNIHRFRGFPHIPGVDQVFNNPLAVPLFPEPPPEEEER